jgi:hypothetical protein
MALKGKNNRAALSRAVAWPLRRVGFVVGIAAALAGCAGVQPQAPLFAPAPGSWPSANGEPAPRIFSPPPPPPASPPKLSLVPRAEAAPSPVRDDPPPLRPVASDPPPLRFPPPVTLLTPPADAADCTGWWRICHFY